MTKTAAAEDRSCLRGIVETVFYSGPTFSAGRLRTADGALVYSMKCDNMPAPPPPPADLGAPAPVAEPELHRSGLFGLSYEAKRPDQ